MGHTGKTVKSTQWHCHCHLAVAEATFRKQLDFLRSTYGISPPEWPCLSLKSPIFSMPCEGVPFHLSPHTSPCPNDITRSHSPALSPEWTSDFISWSHSSDTRHEFSPAPSPLHSDGMCGWTLGLIHSFTVPYLLFLSQDPVRDLCWWGYWVTLACPRGASCAPCQRVRGKRNVAVLAKCI